MPGPYVQMATLCEAVLQEQNGVLSIIRSIDRITVQAHGDDVPEQLPEGAVSSKLVIALKADDATGRWPVTLTVQQPDGMRLPPRSVDVMFEGGERGVNIVTEIQLPAMEGLYWIEVSILDRLLTKMPLRVVYQRLPGHA